MTSRSRTPTGKYRMAVHHMKHIPELTCVDNATVCSCRMRRAEDVPTPNEEECGHAYTNDLESEDKEYDEHEELMELLAELTAKEAKLVAKAQKARDRLRKKKERGKRALLGDICGNWTLHSTQYLDVATQAILETDSYPEGEIEDFETGQLKIGREYLDDIIWHGREDAAHSFICTAWMRTGRFSISRYPSMLRWTLFKSKPGTLIPNAVARWSSLSSDKIS
jgi:hypothetical protein